jgi:hypothetical protein
MDDWKAKDKGQFNCGFRIADFGLGKKEDKRWENP